MRPKVVFSFAFKMVFYANGNRYNWIDTRFDQFGHHVVIPNSTILGSKIQNHTFPNKDQLIWFWPSVYVDPKVPPKQVEKILTEALKFVEKNLVDIWVIMAGLKPSGVMEYLLYLY